MPATTLITTLALLAFAAVAFVTGSTVLVAAFLSACTGVLVGTALERSRAVEPTPARKVDYPAYIDLVRKSGKEIVHAYEIERARIERDLHDGAQQYMVAASMKLGELQLDLDGKHAELLAEARTDMAGALKALRDTVHGIHPQILTEGLEVAVRDLARRFPGVDVRCPHPLPTIDPAITVTAYFCVSEALTNAAKFAPDASVSVLLAADRYLRISVTDQGEGGATIRSGHGLSGIKERLAAFGGDLEVTSPRGGPTTVTASIPLLLETGESGYL